MSASRSKCMEKGCDAAPEHECIWADGRAHAWFCGSHYEPWKKKADKGEDGEGGWLELVKERKVEGGIVGKKYGEEPKAKAAVSVARVLSSFHRSAAPDKYDNINFKPPGSVASTAEKGPKTAGESYGLKGGNEPTNKDLWASITGQAKKKFKWPSATGSAWAVKQYNEKGGGWKKKAHPLDAWGDTVEEATRVVVPKVARSYNRIVMFDFDGTLFRSWEATPDWWDGSELDTGPFSFFVKPESLDEPCVPDKPGSVYWIQKALAAAKEAIQDAGTLTVLITGRVGIHKRRVHELLQQKGLRFDHSYFNPGMSAARFKVVILKNLLAGYNTVSQVEVWENENQKTYDSALKNTARALDRDVKVTVHHVHVPPKELECGPDDFNLPSQNTETGAPEMRMAQSKTSAALGDGSSVGLFIPLPEELAAQFPSLEPRDDSPCHVTFMFIGEVPEEKWDVLISTLRDGMRHLEGPVTGVLDGVDCFQGQDSRVAYSRVRFSQYLAQFHDQLKNHLAEAGFEPSHSFPFLTPHVTLAYMGPHDDWDGTPPEGSWNFSSIQVWGLPELVDIPLGEQVVELNHTPELGARRFARLEAKRASNALLRAQWAGLLDR